MDDYRYYTDEGLEMKRLQLDKQIARAEEYRIAAESTEGQFIIAEHKDQVSFIQRMYRTLRPNEPGVEVQLAALQAEEWALERAVGRITGWKNMRTSAEEEIAEIDAEQQERKRRRDESGGFIPAAAKLEDDHE